MVEAIKEAVSSKDQQSTSVLTVPNAPNWDSEAPACFQNGTLAYCANANVHLLDLTDDGFVNRQTVSFAAKFKKQFCRCVAVHLLPDCQSLLVSLDKRTVIWEQLSQKEEGDNNRPQNFVKSASVGDLVVRFACIKQEKSNMLQRVLAFTQKGHVYRITLSAHRGIAVEQIYSNTSNEKVVVSQIISIEDKDTGFEIVYGTEEGQVKMITKTDSNAVEQKQIFSYSPPDFKVSDVMATRDLIFATSKTGEIKVFDRVKLTVKSFDAPNSDLDLEEQKQDGFKRKKAPPKNLQSYRLLQLTADKILLSGSDGVLYSFTMSLETLQSQDTFEKSKHLLADCGHNMPVLQLLTSVSDDQASIISLGYDRTIIAWQLNECDSSIFLDQVATLACLGQTIDPEMLGFTNSDAQDELIIVQNRPSCQKILQVELPSMSNDDDEGIVTQEALILRTTDLTSTKVLDRSAPISAFAVNAQQDCNLMVFVYDESRLLVYDYLLKEVVKKYKMQGQLKIKSVAVTKLKVTMLVCQKNIVEVQELSLINGKVDKRWSCSDKSIDAGRLWQTKDDCILVSCSSSRPDSNFTIWIGSQGKFELFENNKVLQCSEHALESVVYLHDSNSKTLKVIDAKTGLVLKEATISHDLDPKLVAFLPTQNQLAIVPVYAPSELLILDTTLLQVIKKVSLTDLLRQAQPNQSQSASSFSSKATSIIANTQSLIFASEDKCLRVLPLSLLEKLDSMPLTVNSKSNRKQVKSGQSNKRQKLSEQDQSNDKKASVSLTLKLTEKTMLSIVRSRVFYQQKQSETQKIIADMDNQQSDCESLIDLKLLIFHADPECNKSQAMDVIRAELASCLFIERFEFFQKIVILNLWLCQALGEPLDKVKDLIEMHLPNIKQKEQDSTFINDYVKELDQLLISKDKDQSCFDHLTFLHVRQAKKILSNCTHEETVNDYVTKGCFVEAMVLCKLWSDKDLFIKTLEAFMPILQKENKVQQIAKVSKAIQRLQDGGFKVTTDTN